MSIIRDTTIDLSKALAIFLVTIGHSTKGPISDFIYSFHMPLFFFISGLFLSKYFVIPWEFVRKRTYSLIIPAFIIGILVFAERLYIEDDFSIAIWQQKHSLGYILTYFPWFIICLYICSLIIIFTKSIIKNDITTTLFIIVISFAIPTNVLYINAFMPFVWFGSLFKEYVWNKHDRYLFWPSLVIYLLAYILFWNSSFLCYSHDSIVFKFTNGIFFDKNSFYGNTIRFLTGISGLLCVISMIKYISKYKVFNIMLPIGHNTLGIYVFQFILFNIPIVITSINNTHWMISVLSGILLTLIINQIVVMARKNRISKLLLLGER